jgi:hypothetical protein
MSLNINSSSDAFQDDFVLKMLGYPKSGYFIDLGSGMAVKGSNSFRLELMGWDGICVDMTNHADFSIRNCKFVCNNALWIDYSLLFQENSVPDVVDYLSLDIDEYTTDLMKLVPFNKYTFKIITIEHDAYIRDHALRAEQRHYLSSLGYTLVCSNVKPDSLRFRGLADGPFEDWWIKEDFFKPDLIKTILSNDLYGSEIVRKFGLSSSDFWNI